MGTVKIRPIFWFKGVTMATSHLMTGRYIPHFGLNSLIVILPLVKFFHTLPHHGNDIAYYFESVKSQGCSDGFSNIL